MFTSTSSSRRKTDSDRRDRESPRSSKDKDKDKKRRPSSSRKVSSSSTKDRDRDRDRSPGRERRERRPEASHSSGRSDRKMAVVPEMERRPSIASPRISSYPSFSKAHSKEAVGSREDVINPRPSLYTPDPTDLGSNSRGKGAPDYRRPTTPHGAVPPSPPLTTTEPDLRRTRSENRIRNPPSNIRIVSPPRERKGSVDNGQRLKAIPRRPGSSSTLRHRRAVEVQSEVPSEASGWSQMPPSEGGQEKVAQGEPTDLCSSVNTPGPVGMESTAKSQTGSNMSESTATSIRSQRKTSRGNAATPVDAQSSPLSAPDSSPRTPTPHESTFPQPSVITKDTPAGSGANPATGYPSPYSFHSPTFVPSIDTQSPPPPPPPAPVPSNVPRVDYLLQNGGLPHVVPRRFFSVVTATTPLSAQYPNFAPPQTSGPQKADISAIFAPFQGVLDDYLHVMSKNGSLAVATGYRSVARRLLDRLEAVFNRNISSETCHCVMCHESDRNEELTDEDTGLSWGEILEYVSGRRELSQWPPFVISSDAPKPSLAAVAEAPMQKLDMDIPPEYRDHYIRQSKKTKDVVQAWLKSQPEVPSSPPQEVDNETLIFAMVTHLEPTNRKLFTALLRGMSKLPESRTPTPAIVPEQSELMKRTALALQRLYRLSQPPRDAECAIYLVKNPQLHGVLATLAAVSNGEWEILISGRFDGFLWSGAESPIDSRLPSRGPTPASVPNTPGLPSRGPTPSAGGASGGPMSSTTNSFGAPVQMDEDTEIAVLAEVEREIYAGMDALEDAFEALHAKAEQVREALRLRNAGLSLSASARRGSFSYGPEARLGTPNPSAGIWEAMGREDEDWIDDAKSEIRPDDSASNISYNRRRRRHREKERRTPAPVEEEDEESVVTEDYQPRRR